jgi:hypothetical protein
MSTSVGGKGITWNSKRGTTFSARGTGLSYNIPHHHRGRTSGHASGCGCLFWIVVIILALTFCHGHAGEIPQGTNTSLATLQSDFSIKVQRFISGMKHRDYNVVITQAGRSPSYQQQLYGRAQHGEMPIAGSPGQLAAPPQYSFHVYGRAIDFEFRGSDGQLHSLDAYARKGYEVAAQMARRYGLHGIGSKDMDHLQDAAYSFRTLPKNEYGFIKAN